jgi:hypothetical protein
LKSGTQFAADDSCTAAVSGKTFTFQTATSVTNVVAGYSTDIKIMTVDRRFTGGTSSGTFVIGEIVTQTGTSATGYVLEDDGGTIYVQDASGTFNGTGELTGGVSLETNTPTATAAFTTVPKDIGDGSGDLNYKAVISANITNASAQTIQEVYEWAKFVTRSESTSTEGGPGSTAGIEGRIYRYLDSSYAEKKASPYGTFAGGTMFGAQGVFIDKDTLVTADVQKISLIDDAGSTVTPPNLQSLTVTSLVSGDRVSVFRSTGAASTTILTTEFAVDTVATPYNESGDVLIKVVTASRAVPMFQNVPVSGVLRVEDPSNPGIFLRFLYNDVDRTNGVFTLTSGDIGDITNSTNLAAGDDAFVVFIEEQATSTSLTNTVIYDSDDSPADIPLIVRVRRKGILPFQTTSTFGSTGASIGAVRTTDSIVNLP